MQRLEPDVFEMAKQYEESHPGIAEAMELVGVSMERYEASLSALYSAKIVTSTSTEDLSAGME